MTDATRRAMLLGAGGAGVAAVLTACGGDGGQTTAEVGEPSAAGSADADTQQGQGTLAKTADIPVGGGTVFEDRKVVVTQPAAGEFKAFSSVCTHKGCQVQSVSDGTINCPCHGSRFAIADGSVKQGPATKPLEAKEVKVEGDSIVLT
ncbi:Rieske (2Fe-2S) protein [Streptosporangium sp. NPDC004379]|uniref:Rieske (2Fe-2S) protein n=1 Tax=Streptosporangium sp. NPDC004379 TaxID=3366189 RepID=UPI0036A5DB45